MNQKRRDDKEVTESIETDYPLNHGIRNLTMNHFPFASLSQIPSDDIHRPYTSGTTRTRFEKEYERD